MSEEARVGEHRTVQHADGCQFSTDSMMGEVGRLLLFGGRMKCSCPPAHRKAERRRVLALHRAEASTATSSAAGGTE